MKTTGSLEAAKLKAEAVKDDDGIVYSHDVFWLITVKVPAHRIDANELHRMIGDEALQFELSNAQLSLPLERGDENTVTITADDSEPVTVPAGALGRMARAAKARRKGRRAA